MKHAETRRLTLLAALQLALLAGCNTVPPTNVHQPMTARPAPLPVEDATPGSLFQTGNRLSLFELKRARNVGDLLTVQIEEKSDAKKKANSASARKSSNTFEVPTLVGLPGKSFLNANLEANADQKFEGKGESNASDSFTGVVTVTVIEVFPNGNLLVSGEKQLGLNQGTEFIRFSGVVDPSTIGFGNTVSSTKVADARIEYRGNGQVDSAQIMGWLAKFFMTFLPF